MSLQIKGICFDDLLGQTMMCVLDNFTSVFAKEEDVTLTAQRTDCPHIREVIQAFPKKMDQLRKLYVTEAEIDRSHREYKKTGKGTFHFNSVNRENNHVNGACLTSIEYTQDEVTVNIRASIAPYNLQFDLVLISDLIRELGLSPKQITIKIDYMASKPVHNLYTFVLYGMNREDIQDTAYGRSIWTSYERALTDRCKFNSMKAIARKIQEKLKDQK
jgi:hypothetical protein